VIVRSYYYYFQQLSEQPWKIAVETVEKHEVIRGICRLIDYAVLFWALGDSSLYSTPYSVVVLILSGLSYVLFRQPRRGCGDVPLV
jgi:hypothetical protein